MRWQAKVTTVFTLRHYTAGSSKWYQHNSDVSSCSGSAHPSKNLCVGCRTELQLLGISSKPNKLFPALPHCHKNPYHNFLRYPEWQMHRKKKTEPMSVCLCFTEKNNMHWMVNATFTSHNSKKYSAVQMITANKMHQPKCITAIYCGSVFVV